MLFPFGDTSYKNLDDLFETIKNKCHENGRKNIYVYSTELDSTMHELEIDNKTVANII